MILKELIKIKIGGTKKERDPNWKTLAAKAASGAGGAHKNSKRDLELGKEKHKKKFLEALDEYDQELELYECSCEHVAKKQIKPKFSPEQSDSLLTNVLVDGKVVGKIKKIDDGKTGGYDVRINNKKRWVRTMSNAKKVILAVLHDDKSMLPPGTEMPK